MENHTPITVSSPEGIAIIVGVVLLYAGIRLLPRLLVGFNAYISPAEVKRRLDAKEEVLLVDVRNAGEFTGALGHVPGALNIPLAELKQHLPEGLVLNGWRERPIIAICQSDSRAAFAVRQLKRAGFKSVFVMSGGMMAWVHEEFPVSYHS